MLLKIDDPAIYKERQGAGKNPWRTERPARSLKGVKAARIVRALVDFVPPLGVRQIAELAGTDPSYVSRILEMLGRDDLVRRPPREPVEEVEWAALLRRWTEDYSLLESNRPFCFLDPRGVEPFVENLRTTAGADTARRCALTGSLAARSSCARMPIDVESRVALLRCARASTPFRLLRIVLEQSKILPGKA
ncbi:MAG: helix-turn-helix domain-containing protein [Thermoleophilia bacterium]